jgi:hypothetical protein
MLLASHALAAGPLAASQPGFTILNPLVASLLGLFLFGERVQTGMPHLIGVGVSLGVLVAGASALSHSHLIVGEHTPAVRPAVRAQNSGWQRAKYAVDEVAFDPSPADSNRIPVRLFRLKNGAAADRHRYAEIQRRLLLAHLLVVRKGCVLATVRWR